MSLKTYKVHKQRQLIDLNGDSTNFNLTFTAKSSDGSDFYALVVDQATLDSTPILEYKKAEGAISGNIISDKNVYQNYFLVLKADILTEISVSIEKKEIEPNLGQHPDISKSVTKNSTRKFSMLKIILIIIVVLVGIALTYYFYNYYNKGITSQNTISGVAAGAEPRSGLIEDSKLETIASPLSTHSNKKLDQDDIFSRLNNLSDFSDDY